MRFAFRTCLLRRHVDLDRDRLASGTPDALSASSSLACGRLRSYDRKDPAVWRAQRPSVYRHLDMGWSRLDGGASVGVASRLGRQLRRCHGRSQSGGAAWDDSRALAGVWAAAKPDTGPPLELERSP